MAMSTPIYTQVTESVRLASEGGFMRGIVAERKEALDLIKAANPKPSAAVRKVIDMLEKRLYSSLPTAGDSNDD